MWSTAALTVFVATLLFHNVGAIPWGADRRQLSESFLQLAVTKFASLVAPSGTVESLLSNQVFWYQVSVEIGSNKQPVDLLVDTGSSDTWVFSPGACDSCRGGTYDPAASSSDESVTNLGAFNITYATQDSAVEGYYIQDTFTIGDITLDPLTIGIAESAGSGAFIGILGVGPRGGEADHPNYPNILDEMYSQGFIGKRAYSVSLSNPCKPVCETVTRY